MGTKDHEVTEEWRPIKGYARLYHVSSKGRVRSMHKKEAPIILRDGDVAGYRQLSLFKNSRRRSRRVHRLVAEAFLGRAPKGHHYVNHKNGIRHDNRVENLEWVEPEYNVWHAKNVLLTPSGRPETPVICLNTGTIYRSQHEAAECLGVFVENINHCVKGKRKSTGGFRFRYASKEEVAS